MIDWQIVQIGIVGPAVVSLACPLQPMRFAGGNNGG